MAFRLLTIAPPASVPTSTPTKSSHSTSTPPESPHIRPQNGRRHRSRHHPNRPGRPPRSARTQRRQLRIRGSLRPGSIFTRQKFAFAPPQRAAAPIATSIPSFRRTTPTPASLATLPSTTSAIKSPNDKAHPQPSPRVLALRHSQRAYPAVRRPAPDRRQRRNHGHRRLAAQSSPIAL